METPPRQHQLRITFERRAEGGDCVVGLVLLGVREAETFVPTSEIGRVSNQLLERGSHGLEVAARVLLHATRVFRQLAVTGRGGAALERGVCDAEVRIEARRAQIGVAGGDRVPERFLALAEQVQRVATGWIDQQALSSAAGSL